MKRVFLDGEQVDFQGPPPVSLEGLWKLLDGHLAQSGRRMERLTADGREWRPGREEREGGCACVEAFSAPAPGKDRWSALAGEVAEAARKIAALAEREAGASLSREWEPTNGACLELLEFSKPAIEGLGALVGERLADDPEGQAALEESARTVQGTAGVVVRALREGEAVALSDALGDGLAPAWLGVAELLESRWGAGAPRAEGQA